MTTTDQTIDIDRLHQSGIVVNDFRDDLLSGRTLLLHAQSARSGYGYRPPINHRDWGTAMERLAKMARTSSRLAQVASAIMGKVNLYGTDDQAMASIYEAAFKAMNKPYDDVVGRAGPEAGRYRDHQHAWTLHDRVAVSCWLEYVCRPFASTAPGIGWCLQEIAEMIHYNRPHEQTEYQREREREEERRRARYARKAS